MSRLPSLFGKCLEDEYQIICQLGEGSFAKVLKVKHKQTNKLYAAKIIQNINMQTLPGVQSQINNLKKAKSDHIIQYFHIINDVDMNNQISLIMSLCKSNLRKQIENGTKWTSSQLINFIIQITSAFLELQKHHIIHLDLKPQNILLQNNHYFKICDFGCSQIAQSAISIKNIAGKGTTSYLSPQLRLPQFATISRKQCDIWSLGIIIYEMMYGYHPFEDNSVLQYYDHLFELQWDKIDNDKIWIRDLIKKDMLTKRNQKRITWQQLKKKLLQLPISICSQPSFYNLNIAVHKHISLCFIFINLVFNIRDNIKVNTLQFYKVRKQILQSLCVKIVHCLYIYCQIFNNCYQYKYKEKLSLKKIKALDFIIKNIEIQQKNSNSNKMASLSKIDELDYYQNQIINDCVQIRLSIKHENKFISINMINSFCIQMINVKNQKLSFFCQSQKFIVSASNFQIDLNFQVQRDYIE